MSLPSWTTGSNWVEPVFNQDSRGLARIFWDSLRFVVVVIVDDWFHPGGTSRRAKIPEVSLAFARIPLGFGRIHLDSLGFASIR